MTTYYTEVQTLDMLVAASPLIVVGAVGRVVDTVVDYYNQEPFVRSTFEVTVQEVLKGEPERKVIRVEVMGGEAQDVATPLRAPMREGAALVLMLAPAGEKDAYVPYFSSAFPLDQDGQVVLGARAAERLSSQVAPIAGETLPLDALVSVIQKVNEAQAAAPKAADDEVTGKEPPPVLEMPHAAAGGGVPSAPQPMEPR
jgi:hypothetical protein